MALRRLFFVYFQFSTVLNGILFTEFGTVTCTSVSDPNPTAFDLLANIRPRFKIPRGNLSRYQQPEWEILYFFKYGTFPAPYNYSPQLNRTGFLNKMRLMKDLWDMDKHFGGEVGKDPTKINEFQENDYNWPSSEKDESGNMVNKFRRSKPKGQKIAPNDAFLPIVRKYRRLHPLLRFNSRTPQMFKRAGELYATALEPENYQTSRGKFGETAVERNTRRKFQTQGWK